MLVIDPGNFVAAHCVPRASNAPPLPMRCILSVLYQSLTLVPARHILPWGDVCAAGSFMPAAGGVGVGPCRWCWPRFCWALPQLAALRPAALARVDRVVGRHYMTRLDALQQENFTLHQQLAQSVDALAENAALRQLVGCGRGITGVTPARVVAGASAASRWPARTLRRGMPSSTRAGGTRGSLPARTATPASWNFPPLPGFAAAMPGCHAGAVVLTGPARRLHAGGRGHRDHRGRGLAGHTGHRAPPQTPTA